MTTATKQATIPANAVQERVSHVEGTRIFTVLSRTPGKEYVVTVNETARCTCPRKRAACWHKQEVGKFMLEHDYTSSEFAQDALDQEDRLRCGPCRNGHTYACNGDAWCETVQAKEDAQLQEAIGAWWEKTYGTMTAQEVADLEEEREEAAFWQDFNAARESIISAVNVWIDGYLPKEEPMQEQTKCKAECGRVAGPTGLCNPCLLVQEALRKTATRKAQTCTRMAAHVTDEKVFSIFKTA